MNSEKTREDMEQIVDAFEHVRTSRDRTSLGQFMTRHINGVGRSGHSPTDDVFSMIGRACEHAAKGEWDHPLLNEVRQAFDRAFPEESIDPTTPSHEGDAGPKVR